MNFAKRIAIVGAGSGVAQLVTIASTPLLTRLYPPEAHAIWALFVSVAVLFSGISALRLELAVVLPQERGEAADVFAAGLAVSFVFGGLAFTVCWFTGQYWLPAEAWGELEIWFRALPAYVVAFALYQLSLSWCTRERAFGWHAAAQVVLPLMTVLIQIGWAVIFRPEPAGLIMGSVVGQIMATGCAACAHRQAWSGFPSAWSISRVMKVLRRYHMYPLFMTPYMLLAVVRERLMMFILGRIATPLMVGQYSLAARLANVPTGLASSAIRPVFFQHAASRPVRDSEFLMLLLIREIGMIAIPFWVVFACHSELIFRIVFGPAWAPAGVYAAVLTAPSMVLLLSCWADRMFDVLGRQRMAMQLEMTFTVLSLAGLIVAYLVSKDLMWAIATQAGILSLCYVAWLFIMFGLAGYAAQKLVKVALQLAGWLAFWAVLVLTSLRVLSPEFSVLTGTGVAVLVASMRLRVAYQRLNAIG